MSISPDCCAVSGTYLTLVGSFRIAAATALHTSTSSPVQAPWLSAWEKPARPVFTPQTSWPRCFTASRVLPAYAGAAASRLAETSVQREVLSILMGSPEGGICAGLRAQCNTARNTGKTAGPPPGPHLRNFRYSIRRGGGVTYRLPKPTITGR